MRSSSRCFAQRRVTKPFKPASATGGLVLTLAALLSLGACVSGGFRFEKADGLAIGVSTEDDIRELIGEPRARQSRTLAGKEFILWHYEQVEVWYWEYMPPSVYLQRVLNVEFVNGVVNAYNAESVLKKDKRYFDVTQEQTLEVGAATTADFQQRFGSPHGRCRFPTNLPPFVSDDISPLPDGIVEAWAYSHHADLQKGELLVAYFDAQGTLVGKVVRIIEGNKSSLTRSW